MRIQLRLVGYFNNLLAETNEEEMMDILNDLSDKYCPSCDVGVAS
jgi:uncharacterized protein YutD